MLIDDEAALQEWLVATLEPLCDAEPKALARYVLALVAKDKPLERLRENCIDRLDVFLDRATKDFVDQLFDVIRTRRYIPEAKKENVQPKASESSDEKSGEPTEPLEPLEPQSSASSDKAEQDVQIQNTSNANASSTSEAVTTVQQNSPGTITQPVKRRYPYRSSSGRHHSPNPRRHVNASTGGASRHQNSSHYRSSATSNSVNQRSHRSSSRSRSVSPPPAKRSQRSYSQSSSGSSSRSSPSRQNTSVHPTSSSNTDFLYNKNPCSDFFDNKAYRVLGDSGSYDDGNNTVVFEQAQQQSYYPAYPQYGIPPPHLHSHYHEYNPENPELKRGPHPPPPMFLRHPPPMHHHPRLHGPPIGNVMPNQQPVGQPPLMMNPQRTLVTVVTNAEPLPLETRMRNNEQMSAPNNSNAPMIHQKRHGPNAPYLNDRRSQQHEPSSNHETQNNPSSNNNNNNNSHHNSNNGFNNRGWKRPWQKTDGSNQASATLEIRKIPVEFNTISKLNEHFSKFGTVKNVQIAYDGSPDSALIAYATYSEAETAYKNPQPLFNNRFIKIFWHNNNKGQNTTNNNNNNNQSSQAQAQTTQSTQQSSTAVLSSDLSNSKKNLGNQANPKKLHWIKTQQQSNNKNEPVTTAAAPLTTTTTAITSSVTTTNSSSTAPSTVTATTVSVVTKKAPVPSSNIAKKDAAKKVAIEIHRKKQGLLEEQIQQQKLLLKKFEMAETAAEKDSIRALMKQVDTTIVTLKDSLRSTAPIKSTVNPPTSNPTKPPTISNISQQDALKQRAESLQKEIETLKAKTSADVRRSMSNTLNRSSIPPSTSSSNESQPKENTDQSILAVQETIQTIVIKNIKSFPRSDLEEFLKKSGVKQIQSIDNSDDDLLLTMNSQSDIERIKNKGLKFGDHSLNISFKEESSLNVSGRKRTLSETLEDELLGTTSNEQMTDDPEHEDYEPDAKRPNQSQTSDSEENVENDDEDQLLADIDNQLKNSRDSIPFDEESSPVDENQSNVLDNDELQLLDL